MLREFTLKQHLKLYWEISKKSFPASLHSIIHLWIIYRLSIFLVDMIFKTEPSDHYYHVFFWLIFADRIGFIGVYLISGPKKLCANLKIDFPSEILN